MSDDAMSDGAVGDDAVLELDDVSKVYGSRPPVAALRGASFAVRRGSAPAIWSSSRRKIETQRKH